MENLNAETVKKELEGLADFRTCPDYIINALALITSQEQKIKELTDEYESMAKSVVEADELIRKLRADKKKLTEENERLRAQNQTLEIKNKDFKYRIYELSRDNEEWEHENKDLECDNDMLRERITEVKAETVRKMHSEIKERCIKGGIYPAFVARTIDQIAKEMLEGE